MKIVLIKDLYLQDKLQRLLGPDYLVLVSDSGEKAIEYYDLHDSAPRQTEGDS
jgi:hypothetical protein